MKDRTEGAKYSTALPWEGDYNQGEYLGIKNFSMNAGAQFGFMLTQHTSIQELADNPERYNKWGKLPLFSIAEANPDYSGNAPQQFAALDGSGTFGFEAVRVDRNGSDRDYNEAVFQVIGATGNAPYYGDVRNPGRNFRLSTIGEQIREESQQNVLDDGYFTIGKSGEIKVDLLFDGGWYKGEVGIFSLEGMNQHESGSLAFIQEAATRALTNSTQGHILFQDQVEGARFDGNFSWERNFNSGIYQGAKTFQLNAGGKYGLMLVPHTTLAEIAINPTLDGSKGKRPFFSMKSANLLNAVQMIEHQTNTDNMAVIGMEDLNVFFGGDRDYNDIILNIEGASMYAPGYENEKDPKFKIDYAPIANNDTDLTFKDTAINIALTDLFGNDYDFDGDTIGFDSFNDSGTLGLVQRVNNNLVYNPNGQGHASLGVIDGNQVGKVDKTEGLILTGDQAFYANVRHQTNAQGLSLSSKGQLALGTEFRSGHLVTNTAQDWRKAHFISVMASEDNTVVSFKDLPEGVEFVNGYPGQVTLDKYESFVVGLNVQDNVNLPNSLQGSLIVSDKPIAVNTGSWLAGTVGNGRDIG